ncbi:MAG TPA: L,D-transpeptidase family protein [Xanthobacteraceae bacterium]|jgi:murein L,D-transpeptidase YcbB/YkuD|nr:L,D-transpeptidase family protein [Xanthobacteraceae bacterium]
MRGPDRILTGTAIALILALGGSAQAQTAPNAGTISSSAVDTRVPMPDTDNPPPPTIADINAPAAQKNETASAPAITNTVAEPAKSDTTKSEPAKSEPAKTALADPMAEKLREMVTGKALDRVLDRKKDRAGVETFYAGRNYAPLWLENNVANARAKAAIARLKQADEDGLDPADYRTPEFSAGMSNDALADAELKLTAAVLTYARHAQTGRVHFSRVSADIFYNQVLPESADVLAKMAETKDVATLLDNFSPPHEAYKALRAKLAEARHRHGDAGIARIASGPVLKVGMKDERVPQLRDRLGVSADGDANTYDKTLAAAVKKFQNQRDLNATGTLTVATVLALNGPKRDRDADIILANMERWRWMPRDLGKSHVIVNLPEFVLRVYSEGSVAWITRIVDGKPTTPTPLLSETMKYITVNPTWNVPPSIINNEYLPALQQDPQALERIGLKIEQNRDGTVHIFQPPGEANALGRIRFNFPNKFLVYQHDTPDKHLFARDTRAYSHGCMRVQNPDKYAEVLLSISQPKDGYTAERIRKMYGSGEHDIQLAHHIPVHLTYQTASVDTSGKLVIRDDLYGRDARLIAILKGEERKVAETPVEHREAPSVRPQKFQVQTQRQDTGFSFFQRLFR